MERELLSHRAVNAHAGSLRRLPNRVHVDSERHGCSCRVPAGAPPDIAFGSFRVPVIELNGFALTALIDGSILDPDGQIARIPDIVATRKQQAESRCLQNEFDRALICHGFPLHS